LGTVYGSTLASNVTTVIGYQAGASTSGNDNTGLGYRALYQNTSGTENVAIGTYALQTNTTASDSVAIGRYALYSSNGIQNTAVGANTLYSNTSGTNNTACGQSAGYSLTSSNNTAIGQNALSALTSSGDNIALGYKAGYLCTGSTNVFIGNSTAGSSANNNYEIVIGTAGTTGKGGSTGYINPQGGGVYQGNNSATWSVTSDQRLKKNIVDHTDGLDKIIQLKIRNFEYRTEEEITELAPSNAVKIQGVQLGLIAQELAEVLPDCVKTESTGVMSVDSTNILWHMVNAIKDLKAIVDAQAVEIAELKAKVA
jgi:hypothetical protein